MPRQIAFNAYKKTIDVSALDVTIDDSPTTAQISDLEVGGYTHFAIGFECTSTGVGAHNFDIIVSFSADGTNYQKLQNEFWGFLRYEDTAFSSADTVLLNGEIPAGALYMQIDIVGNSTTASLFFTFDDWFLGLNSHG
jgi:hypothetical protein